MSVRLISPTSTPYQSQFVPLPVELMGTQLAQHQQSFDQARATADATNFNLEAAPWNTEFVNELSSKYNSKLSEIRDNLMQTGSTNYAITKLGQLNREFQSDPNVKSTKMNYDYYKENVRDLMKQPYWRSTYSSALNPNLTWKQVSPSEDMPTFLFGHEVDNEIRKNLENLKPSIISQMQDAGYDVALDQFGRIVDSEGKILREEEVLDMSNPYTQSALSGLVEQYQNYDQSPTGQYLRSHWNIGSENIPEYIMNLAKPYFFRNSKTAQTTDRHYDWIPEHHGKGSGSTNPPDYLLNISEVPETTVTIPAFDNTLNAVVEQDSLIKHYDNEVLNTGAQLFSMLDPQTRIDMLKQANIEANSDNLVNLQNYYPQLNKDQREKLSGALEQHFFGDDKNPGLYNQLASRTDLSPNEQNLLYALEDYGQKVIEREGLKSVQESDLATWQGMSKEIDDEFLNSKYNGNKSVRSAISDFTVKTDEGAQKYDSFQRLNKALGSEFTEEDIVDYIKGLDKVDGIKKTLDMFSGGDYASRQVPLYVSDRWDKYLNKHATEFQGIKAQLDNLRKDYRSKLENKLSTGYQYQEPGTFLEYEMNENSKNIPGRQMALLSQSLEPLSISGNINKLAQMVGIPGGVVAETNKKQGNLWEKIRGQAIQKTGKDMDYSEFKDAKITSAKIETSGDATPSMYVTYAYDKDNDQKSITLKLDAEDLDKNLIKQLGWESLTYNQDPNVQEKGAFLYALGSLDNNNWKKLRQLQSRTLSKSGAGEYNNVSTNIAVDGLNFVVTKSQGPDGNNVYRLHNANTPNQSFTFKNMNEVVSTLGVALGNNTAYNQLQSNGGGSMGEPLGQGTVWTPDK